MHKVCPRRVVVTQKYSGGGLASRMPLHCIHSGIFCSYSVSGWIAKCILYRTDKNVRQRPTFLLYVHTIVINCWNHCRKSRQWFYSWSSTSQWPLITTVITNMWHFASWHFMFFELRLLNSAISPVDIWGLHRICSFNKSSSSLSWGTPWVTSWVTPWVPSWVPSWGTPWVTFWVTPFVDLIILGAIRCVKKARHMVKPQKLKGLHR